MTENSCQGAYVERVERDRLSEEVSFKMINEGLGKDLKSVLETGDSRSKVPKVGKSKVCSRGIV